MDLPNTIIGTILFLVLILPILIINRNGNKKTKKLITQLNLYANKQNKDILEFDTWTNNSIIAMSSDKENIFFYRKKNSNVTAIDIPVKLVKNCFLNDSKNGDKTIHTLELVFEMHPNNETINLEFFKTDDQNFVIGEEMRIAKKWATKLNY